MAGDIYWSNVSLLIGGSPADGSPLVDVGPLACPNLHSNVLWAAQSSAAPVLFGNTAPIAVSSNAGSVFGFNGGAFEFPSGTDFTLEQWFFMRAPTTGTTLISSDSPVNTGEYAILFDVASPVKFRYNFYQGNVQMLPVSNTVLFATGMWQHIAITRQGTIRRAHSNGVLFDEATDTYNYGTGRGVGVWGDTLASYPPSSSDRAYTRITKGVARYTHANFTPSPFLEGQAISGPIGSTPMQRTPIIVCNHNRQLPSYGQVQSTH